MASTSRSPQIDDIARVDSQLNSKHTIFLSHSGAQKAFVEQLYEDLKRRGQSPFFDQSPDSLPKGERFAERIFKAAKECTVAVVVLSDAFLESKWAMLELATFVEAKITSNKKLCLFPLFYKLEASQLKEATTTKMALWKGWADNDERIHLDEWINAVRVLAGANGEVYSKYGGSKVRYRKAIVDAVCQLCRRHGQEDRVPLMVGKDQLCKSMEDEFGKSPTKKGVSASRMVGLYGPCGMGKTFICKALCDHFSEEFSGRVCYVECSDGINLELLKLILEELTDIDEKTLQKIKIENQAYDALKRYLPQQDVFLALDDLRDHQYWLPLTWLSAKSKVMVTSRSKVNVESLVGSDGSCLPCPTLTESDAVKLFLQSAGCAEYDDNVFWKDHEMETLKKCVELSYFLNDDFEPALDVYEELKLVSMETDEETVLRKCIELSLSENDSGSSVTPDSSEKHGHYNLLVLVAMGTTIKEDNALGPKNLIEKCKRWEPSQQHEGRKLMDALETEHALLTPDEKTLVLDVALNYPVKNLEATEAVGLLDRLLKWLGTVDDRPRGENLQKLRKVKALNVLKFQRYEKRQEMIGNVYASVSIEGRKAYAENDFDHAMRCLDKAIEILTLLEVTPGSTHSVFDGKNAAQKVHGENFMYRALIRRKDYRKSLEDFEHANLFYPKHPYIYHKLGEIKIAIGQFGEGCENLTEAIALYPTTKEGILFANYYAVAYAARAWAKHMQQNPVGAMQDIDFAYALDPSNHAINVVRENIRRPLM